MRDKGPTIKKENCPHTGNIKVDSSDEKECEVCSAENHLRLCTSCGKVLCCESHNAHNTEHYEETKHPIIKAVHADYDFTWCYECGAYLE